MDELHTMSDDEADKLIAEEFADLIRRVGGMEVARYASTLDTKEALRDLYRRAGVDPDRLDQN